MKRFAVVVKVLKKYIEKETYEIEADDLDDAINIVRKSPRLLPTKTEIVGKKFNNVVKESSTVNRDECYEIKESKTIKSI